MKDNLKISIITVCFNSGQTINDTIQSVLNQSYQYIEYIIIDGLSNDNTLDIANKYKDKIDYIISEKDDGMYDAINKGISLASGDIIGILNADDFYTDNDVIKDVVNKLSQSKCRALYANLYYVDRLNTNKIIRYWKSGYYSAKRFIYGWMPPHPTFFVYKSVYREYGKFNLDLKSAADYELMLRFLYKFKVAAVYLDRVVVKMRVGGISNVSLKNRIKANREDKKAWQINNIKPSLFTFYLKPLRKLFQFINN